MIDLELVIVGAAVDGDFVRVAVGQVVDVRDGYTQREFEVLLPGSLMSGTMPTTTVSFPMPSPDDGLGGRVFHRDRIQAPQQVESQTAEVPEDDFGTIRIRRPKPGPLDW